MALRRRGQSRIELGIWPGFVDAMTAMLLVLTFVLSIFMITQYFLRDTILGQEAQITNKDAALASLTSRIDSLADMLSLERDERAGAEAQAERLRASLADLSTEKSQTEEILEQISAQLAETEATVDLEREKAAREAAQRRAFEELAASLRSDLAAVETRLAGSEEALTEAEKQRVVEAAAAAALREKLASSETELTAMELALEDRRREAEETLILLAAAQSARETLETELSEQAAELDAREADLRGRDALLAAARTRLADVTESTLEEQKQVALLNEQTRALRQQIAALSRQLGESEQARAQLETEAVASEERIGDLGTRLNTALAERNAALEEARQALEEQVDELSDFRSEFFGRVKAAIANRDDIEIVGDRFVFQSEVLFEPGSADLNDAGKDELAKFAAILNAISRNIPRDLNWILRIDGHTDSRALLPGRTPYRNNWELSQARALSVAEYLMTEHGVPPRRLAPTGFGEYQPLSRANTREAFARNRRIELKLTER